MKAFIKELEVLAQVSDRDMRIRFEMHIVEDLCDRTEEEDKNGGV